MKPPNQENERFHVPWYVELPAMEILEMRGTDGLDLLQRISTNDLTRTEPGNWSQTVLTNEKGRIIDLLSVCRIQSDLLYLACGSQTPGKTKEWIEKFIIMEDAQLSSSNQPHVHIVVIGEHISIDDPVLRFEEEWSGTRIRHLVVKGSMRQSILDSLEGSGVQKKSPDEFEDYRISVGIPRVGAELSDEFNPLEAGLGHLISWTKGCYIGQEVIARLDTYKKVQKHLVRLELTSKVDSLPARITGPAGEIGIITSVTIRPPYKGLGYVAAKYADTEGEKFAIDGSNDIQVTLKG